MPALPELPYHGSRSCPHGADNGPTVRGWQGPEIRRACGLTDRNARRGSVRLPLDAGLGRASSRGSGLTSGKAGAPSHIRGAGKVQARLPVLRERSSGRHSALSLPTSLTAPGKRRVPAIPFASSGDRLPERRRKSSRRYSCWRQVISSLSGTKSGINEVDDKPLRPAFPDAAKRRSGILTQLNALEKVSINGVPAQGRDGAG